MRKAMIGMLLACVGAVQAEESRWQKTKDCAKQAEKWEKENPGVPGVGTGYEHHYSPR